MLRAFMVSLLIFLPTLLKAASVDLSNADKWVFYGTVYGDEKGFILGDSDGYTEGDSCWSKWYGDSYDYDVAISKIAVKAPFKFKFEADIGFTNYGYNNFHLVCLPENATPEMFNGSCGDSPPVKGVKNGYLAVGTRWEKPNTICASIGDSHNYNCTSITEWFNEYEIVVDANGYGKVYMNGNLIAEGQAGTCPSGYYMFWLQDFESQIDFIEGEVEAEDIIYVDELGTQKPIETDEYKKGYEDGYNKGFEDGKNYCRQNPEDCGITCAGEGDYCATFDLFTNTLRIPCFTINNSFYELDLGIVGYEPVTLGVKGIREIHPSK